jgi:hypothetical protein
MNVTPEHIHLPPRVEGRTYTLFASATSTDHYYDTVEMLLAGMRMCLRGNVPVVGLPLNANRCGSWMGEVHPNSISLRRLEDLIT